MSLKARLQEFAKNVWDHSADPFQASFDDRRSLNPSELNALRRLLKVIRTRPDDVALAAAMRGEITEHGHDLMNIFLQVAGLTRNKILQDLKGHARATGKSLRLSNSSRLAFHEETWKSAGPYLAKRLRRVLSHVARLAKPEDALQALNQATWPGYIRQERAKRSGHEAEYRLATLFASCEIAFQPRQKAENPLCPDADVCGVSFDIVVPRISEPKLLVKSTVHTANIGQYGESKDSLEMDEARRMLDTEFARTRKPLLLAFVDGVGFESNRAGLTGVLEKSDEFCQFRTIWKAVVMAASILHTTFRLALPERSIAAHKAFLRRYKFRRRTTAIERVGEHVGVEAGEGLIQTHE